MFGTTLSSLSRGAGRSGPQHGVTLIRRPLDSSAPPGARQSIVQWGPPWILEFAVAVQVNARGTLEAKSTASSQIDAQARGWPSTGRLTEPAAPVRWPLTRHCPPTSGDHACFSAGGPCAGDSRERWVDRCRLTNAHKGASLRGSSTEAVKVRDGHLWEFVAENILGSEDRRRL